MKDSRPVIRMRNISKSFGGVHALKNVQLDIFSGKSMRCWVKMAPVNRR